MANTDPQIEIQARRLKAIAKITSGPHFDNLELVLAVSTSNITAKDGELISKKGAPCRMMEHDQGFGTMLDCANLDNLDGHQLYDFGFSISFVNILSYAHQSGFDRLYFDGDAPELEGWTTFEW